MSTALAEDPRLKDYAFWMGALRGNPPELTRGIAEPGFYRNRGRDGKLTGIAIWRNGEGDLVARVGHAPTVEANADWCEYVFAWCAKHPVTEEAYRGWLKTGSWPEDVPEATSHPANAAPHEVLAETISELRTEAERWHASIGGAVSTKEQADKAANFRDRFAELEKEAVSAHKAAKEPHLKAGREVDSTWKPIAAEGDNAKRWAASLNDAFLRAEKAKALALAAEKAKAGEAVRPEDIKVKAGTRGRSTSLRSFKEFRCTDHAALWAHYRDDERISKHPDVIRVVAKLAELEINAGRTIPGATIAISERAV